MPLSKAKGDSIGCNLAGRASRRLHPAGPGFKFNDVSKRDAEFFGLVGVNVYPASPRNGADGLRILLQPAPVRDPPVEEHYGRPEPDIGLVFG